tara:strand:+ start:107 stop:724 length:618 start_codon:yes stop_codon:yes gene_type:complete
MATYIDSSTGVLTEGDPWVLISSTTLGSTTSRVTFTSGTGSTDYKNNWSQYADLILLINGRSDASRQEDYVRIEFENKASAYWVQATYMLTAYDGSGKWVGAQGESGRLTAGSAGANERGFQRIEMFDINSGKYKTVYSRYSQAQATTPATGIYSFTWADTSDGMLSVEAISEMDIFLEHGDFVATTRFDLIGVLPRMIENTAVG